MSVLPHRADCTDPSCEGTCPKGGEILMTTVEGKMVWIDPPLSGPGQTTAPLRTCEKCDAVYPSDIDHLCAAIFRGRLVLPVTDEMVARAMEAGELWGQTDRVRKMLEAALGNGNVD